MESDNAIPSLKLASYNIRKARGQGWRHDPARALGVINALGSDVVALQEADHRLGDRPAAIPRETIERETDYYVAPVAEAGASLGWHGNAVLIRKGISHGKVSRIDLPGLEPRGAVAVEIKASLNVTVIATHLGLMRRDRRAQLRAIVEQTQTGKASVVLGDFNEWSDAVGLEPLESRFSVIAPGRTFHAARPIASLDRIAHCAALTLKNAGVEDSPSARRASDHIPVWAELEGGASARPEG